MKTNFKLLVVVLVALFSFQLSAQQGVPDAIGLWYFDGNNPLVDRAGNFDKLILTGAKITDEGLVVAPKQWAKAHYNGKKAITEKTLLAKATINSLTGAGSLLTLDHFTKDVFDGIILGEGKAGQWIAGSNLHSRTNQASNTFVDKVGRTVVLAITYKKVGNKCQVSIYRNGKLLGKSYDKGSIPTYQSDVEALFGTRHTNPTTQAPIGFASATIKGAAIFDVALDAATIKKISDIETNSLDGKTFLVESASPDAGKRVLDSDGYSLNKNGTKVQLWQNDAAHNFMHQRWKFVSSDKDEDLYHIVSMSTNAGKFKYLNVSEASLGKNGGLIQLWENTGGLNQLWKVTENSDGTYSISSAAPRAKGGSLTVGSTQNRNGGKVELWTSEKSNMNQKWHLMAPTK